MILRSPKPILWRVFPVILGASALTVASTSWYATHYFERVAYNRSKELLSRETQLLSTLTKPKLQTKAYGQLDHDIKNLAINARSRFTIIAPDGHVVADSQHTVTTLENHADRPEIRPTLSGQLGIAVRYSRTTQSQALYVARPVIADGKVVGVVRAGMSLDYINRAAHGFYLQMIGAGLLIMCIISAIGYITYRWLATPLETLRDGIERLSSGDFKHRLSLPTDRGMADITNAVNAMASQLDERFQSLQNEQLEKETLLSSLFDGIIVTDCSECVLTVNGIAADILSIKETQARGQKIATLIRNSALISLIRKTIQTKSANSQEIIFRSNQDAFYQVDCIPVKESTFAVRKILVVFHNITQTKRIQSARRQMIMSVSTHLKVPVARIQDSLNTKFGTQDRLESDAKLMTTILNDLIYLTQFEDDVEQQKLTFTMAHVETIINDAKAILSELADDKSIAISGNAIAPIHIESFMQVFLHLLRNAITYSPSNGEITVKIWTDTDRCLIEICDDGIGIPDQDIVHIFKPFYRIDTPAHQEVKGGGLGLAIVKSVIDAHLGVIMLESELGKGTSVRIEIPKTGGSDVIPA